MITRYPFILAIIIILFISCSTNKTSEKDLISTQKWLFNIGNKYDLAELKTITKLVIESDKLNDESIQKLRHLKTLKHLRIYDSGNITDKGLSFLSELKKLELLELRQTSFEGSAISYLKDLENFKSLILFKNDFQSDDQLHHFKNLKHLKSFVLVFSNRYINNNIFPYLQNLKELEELHIVFSLSFREGFGGLGKLKKLKKLSLTSFFPEPRNLEPLRQLTQLRYLDIPSIILSNTDFKILRNFKHLRVLNLSTTSLTSERLKRLYDLQFLEHLYLNSIMESIDDSIEPISSESLLKLQKAIPGLKIKYIGNPLALFIENTNIKLY